MRLPLITSKDSLPAEAQHHFDAIAASRGGRVGGPFAVMMHSPDVASRTAHVGTYVRFESVLPQRLRELAAMVASREFDCEYEWGAHAAGAAREGVPQAAIEAIAAGGEPGDLPEEESLIVRYGRQLLATHRVDDETFEAVRALLGEQGVIDLTATLGYYAMIACSLNVAEVTAGEGAPALPPLDR